MNSLPWIGYLRVSTEEQDKSGLGLEAQEDRVRAMGVVKGVTVVTVTEAASAKSLDRPVLQTALRAVRDGEAAGIIVAKLDRLTRSVRDLAALLEAGVAFISCAETVDTSTATGRMMLNVIVTIAQWERETIGERTREALAAKRKRGEALGNVPYGFKSVGGRVATCDKEQDVLLLIKDLRSTMTVSEIAKELNNRRMETRAGTAWKYQYVQKILKDEAHA